MRCRRDARGQARRRKNKTDCLSIEIGAQLPESAPNLTEAIPMQFKALCLLILFAAVVVLPGCPPSSPSPKPAPAPTPSPTGCGTLAATVKGGIGGGSLAGRTNINTTASFTDSGGTATWVENGNTGTNLDGISATGPVTGTAPSRSFTATTTSGDYTLTVSGTIAGPPIPCTVTGSWILKVAGVGQVGVGTWSVP